MRIYTLLGCTALVFAMPVAAQTGPYAALRLGTNSLSDVEVTYTDAGGTFGGTGTTDTAEGEVGFKNAISFGGALGYDTGMLRIDLEVDYARNKADELSIDSINGTAITLDADDREAVCDYLEADSCGGSGNSFAIDGSRARQLTALANVWFDIPAGAGFSPYVGGGLGVIGYELDGEGKAQFGYQVGAGVSFDVDPSVALTADIRHRRAKGTTIDYGDGAGLEIGRVRSTSLLAGVRFTF